MKRWVGFSMLLACIMLFAVADVALTLYSLNTAIPVLAEKGLLLCTALLVTIVVWNFANILISLNAVEVMR